MTVVHAWGGRTTDCLCLGVSSKKVRIGTKLNDIYLHLPESLLSDDKKPALAASETAAEAGANGCGVFAT